MLKTRQEELVSLASEIRKDIVRMVGVARSGPLELPLSISDLLVYLYWEELLLVADSPVREDRDRLMLGIGDGAPALYAVLARRGYFEREELWHYRRLGAMLQAFPDVKRTPGIDAPCIATGSELAVASAFAESLRYEGRDPRVFCVLGEENCSNPDFLLESERTAKIKLDNLILIIVLPCRRRNLSEGSGNEHETKLLDLGWTVHYVDGNNFNDMEKVFSSLNIGKGKPTAIFMSTKNGKVISFIEGESTKFTRSLSMEDMDQALEELEDKSSE